MKESQTVIMLKVHSWTAWNSLAACFQLHFQYCISKKSFMKSVDEKNIFINIYNLFRNLMSDELLEYNTYINF